MVIFNSYVKLPEGIVWTMNWEQVKLRGPSTLSFEAWQPQFEHLIKQFGHQVLNYVTDGMD
jgi:hypothetical protein